MQKTHITLFINFSLAKSVADVSCNCRLVLFKQDRHLILRQPHSLIFQFDIQLRLAVFGLIEDYFASALYIVRLHISFIFQQR